MFFTSQNAMKIDAIRITIEEWKKQDLINDKEYYFLLTTLIENVPNYANTTAHFVAFLKHYKTTTLIPFKIKKKPILINNFQNNKSFCEDIIACLSKINKQIDILYLDPPYNERQYNYYFHLLETIARYDYPEIKGKAGNRINDKEQKSLFCNKKTAIQELEKILNFNNYNFLFLSYNDEGILSKSEILSLLQNFGESQCIEIPYKRYISNKKTKENRKEVIEYLFCLKKF
jgi:adenine-specific DNA-methyltransferase